MIASMDPFRARREPPAVEEPADDDPGEETGMELVRLFRRKWLTLTVFACVVGTALLVPGYVLALWGLAGASGAAMGFALLVEVANALIYLSPLWVWGAARDEIRKESWGINVGGWIVSGPRPRWLFWMVPASVPVSIGGLLMTGFDGFLAARIVYFIVWLFLCLSTMEQVGVLRWTRTEDGKRVLELEDRSGRRLVVLESLDVEAGRIRFVDYGRSLSWRAVSPLDRLARDVKKSPLGKM